MNITDLPAIGQPLQNGIFAGLTTTRDGAHCAVILLENKPIAALPWGVAMEWAASLDAELPTRPVAALLYANLRDQFEPRWHWTSEEYGPSSAWVQDFYDGHQNDFVKSFESKARAVRLVPLTT